MASVAVPMITSKAIGMVGEKMGLDPRLTAIAGMAGGFGAGQAYTSFTGANATNAANAAGRASNTAAQAVNKGIGFGNAEGQALWNASNMPSVDHNAIVGRNVAGFNAHAQTNLGSNPAFQGLGLPGFKPEAVGAGLNPYERLSVDAPFKPRALQGMQSVGEDVTFKDQWGKDIDKWKTRPVDKETGEETGLSPFENLGSEMLGTLMQDLPEEPRQQHQGGGGGGGGSAGAYQGGGSGSYKALDWFPNKEGFKPQGI